MLRVVLSCVRARHVCVLVLCVVVVHGFLRALGFGIEVVADAQKSRWRALPGSKGRYIDTGLWRYSRHPNYFGEWVLWVGQFVLCANGWASMRHGGDHAGAFPFAAWLCALSPLFVYLLLNYGSGVPLLEKSSDERWGTEAAYLAYKKETWIFFLLPTRRTPASRSHDEPGLVAVPATPSATSAAEPFIP